LARIEFNGDGGSTNGSTLNYCTFDHAHLPVMATNSKNLAISHCTFKNSDFYGTDAAALRFYNSTPYLSYDTLAGQSNSWSGIRFASGSAGAISSSVIENLGGAMA